MVEFLARPKKTKTKRPVKFKTKDGTVSFKEKTSRERIIFSFIFSLQQILTNVMI